MKKLTLAAAALVAIAASVSSAHAQDDKMMAKPMMQGTAMMVPAKMSAADDYKTSWVYRNLDMREVNRYRAEGLKDDTIKGAANIALRTGLPLDNVIRLLRESGYSLYAVATMYNVAPKVVTEDIPGYGLGTMGMMMQPAMMQPGMMPPASMPAPAP